MLMIIGYCIGGLVIAYVAVKIASYGDKDVM